MSTRRFRIALSFAGETRDFVAKVAAILADQFGKDAILYDKFHEAEFATYDRGITLPKLYAEESDLIVPVLCPSYDQKPWTGWEWVHIYTLLTRGDAQRVMPCRFGLANVEGLSSAAAFIELDDRTPEDIADRILERLALNEGKPIDYYIERRVSGRRASTTTPNNLPRLQAFFGRDAELEAVREALDPESRTWGALIDGPGGMGKTSLAVRAAYDCPPGQFQRIIFVSIKDRELDDDGVRTQGNLLVPGFLEMLNEIARELKQPDIAKAAEDQRIRLVLDALRPAQALLILDNLESLSRSDRDQLLTLVKRLPQGCKAILTSRRRIGSGSELVQLEKLDPDAALATLGDLARHNRLLATTNEAERLTLWTHTGGNPLLLRWVAGQLGLGHCRTFTDALDFLRSCPEGNDPLEFIFGDLADEFTPEEERVLVALTYFALPARVKHIATVSGIDEELAGTALDTLANRSLVVPDQEEQQYALVPMVADFLRKHRPDVVRETGNRLEQRAYALIVENGYQEFDLFPALDAAWPAVAPALPLILAGPNDRLQTVSEALLFFLEFTGRWDEWLSLTQQAERKAVAAGDLHNAGWRACDAAYIFKLRAQGDDVLSCADQMLTHFEAAQAGVRARAFAAHFRGVGHELKGDHPTAIKAFSYGLELLRGFSAESGDVAMILNDLAGAEMESGDFAAAERDYREAVRMAGAVGDEGGRWPLQAI
jgi:hypothetical protein